MCGNDGESIHFLWYWIQEHPVATINTIAACTTKLILKHLICKCYHIAIAYHAYFIIIILVHNCANPSSKNPLKHGSSASDNPPIDNVLKSYKRQSDDTNNFPTII